jgi:periplasmic divalent cation tolerance protein
MNILARGCAMPRNQEFELISITTTVGHADDAQRLAQGLLSQRLAACVQVEEGLLSHYPWQGGMCCDAEWRLTIKTVEALLPAVRAFFEAQHPYELPQFLWQSLGASPAYAGWVREQVDAG